MADGTAHDNSYTTSNRLVTALYLLARDHVPVGGLERVILDVQEAQGKDFTLSSRWLAMLAEDMAWRLTGVPADHAAMPVPRCDQCKHWRPMDVRTDKKVWGQCRQVMADAITERSTAQAVGNHRGMPNPAELRTAESFGCVNWDARDGV